MRVIIQIRREEIFENINISLRKKKIMDALVEASGNILLGEISEAKTVRSTDIGIFLN